MNTNENIKNYENGTCQKNQCRFWKFDFLWMGFLKVGILYFCCEWRKDFGDFKDLFISARCVPFQGFWGGKTYFCWHRVSYNCLKMILNLSQMVSPPPPSPRQQKSPARGQINQKKKAWWGPIIFMESKNNIRKQIQLIKTKKKNRRRPSSIRRRPSSIVVRHRRRPSTCISWLDQVVEHI